MAALPEPTVKWVLFSWQGRLGRQSYFWAAMLLILVQIYMLTKAAGFDQSNHDQMVQLGFGAIFVWLATAWAAYAMTLKRIHDIGWPNYYAFGIFLPMFSMLFIFAMMLVPGSPETNQHGPPPFPKDKQHE